jgi:threonine dehydratase
MKLVVEPSGATGLAALRAIVPEIYGMKVGVIISGGNTDFRWLAR